MFFVGASLEPVMLIIIGVFFYNLKPLTIAANIIANRKKLKTQSKLANIEIKWKRNTSTNSLHGDIKITNSSEHTLKDFKIKVLPTAASGTVIGPAIEKTIYQSLVSGETKFFENINFGTIDAQVEKFEYKFINSIIINYK